MGIICSYIDNELNGEYKSYYDNRQLDKICTYIDGKKMSNSVY